VAERILVVDDEKLIRWSLREHLTGEGYEVLEAENGATAARFVEEGAFDLALIDVRLPDTDGMALLTAISETLPDVPVIIVTAFSTVDGAVDAMKSGAFDYVTKPFNMEELSIAVKRALETTQLRRKVSEQVDIEKARFGLGNVIGKSPGMLRIKELVERIAQSETTTVLLLGESGTGKDMIARAIHYESNRVDAPFMNITCTALPESLLESELFGYEKGAFTDAKTQKRGLFELADGGTVFMDEIGDMTPALQAKLLRVLEDKAFKRIGGSKDISVDIRVIAATNSDLEKAIEKNAFREDLYYRISIVPVYIPPLRERPEDIPLLANHFITLYNTEFRRSVQSLSAEALDRIQRYDWPGNVRELRNVIERAVLLGAGDVIAPDDIQLGRSVLGPKTKQDRYVVRLPENGCNLADVETDLVRQALQRTNGNQTQAAKLLGLTRDQIRYKAAKLRDLEAKPPTS